MSEKVCPNCKEGPEKEVPYIVDFGSQEACGRCGLVLDLWAKWADLEALSKMEVRAWECSEGANCDYGGPDGYVLIEDDRREKDTHTLVCGGTLIPLGRIVEVPK